MALVSVLVKTVVTFFVPVPLDMTKYSKPIYKTEVLLHETKKIISQKLPQRLNRDKKNKIWLCSLKQSDTVIEF